MIETWVDIVRLGAAGAAGGLIYWASRNHGAVFVQLWNRVAKR